MLRKAVARFFGLAFFGVGVARAQAGGTFELPAECGSESEFREELVGLVGPDAERARPTAFVIVRASATEDYRLTLEVRGERRELTHADCRVLFRSALVIAAASVRPPAPEATPPEASPPPPAVAPPVQAEPERPRADSTVPPRRVKIGGSLSGGAGFALGVLPGAAGVFELRGALLVGMFGFSLSGKYLPPRSASTEGREADIHAFGLRGAASIRPIDLLALSVGFDADLLVGEGTSGVATREQDSAWTFAPSLEFAVIPINTKHFALEIALQGRYAVQQPVFEVTGFGEIYQVPPFGMLSLVRGVWHFP